MSKANASAKKQHNTELKKLENLSEMVKPSKVKVTKNSKDVNTTAITTSTGPTGNNLIVLPISVIAGILITRYALCEKL